jgi:O-acetyl-ADP-ribose deacetylase (regulator of RNase III)
MTETIAKNIVILEGNIFESKCEVIVNPTNSIGIMGAGLAKAFRTRYPDVCEHYNCYSNSFQMNYRSNKIMPPIYYESGFNKNDKAVLMFATKIHWKNPSEYKFISNGLDETKSILIKYGSPSIAFPALGCGLGGLKFQHVLSLIERTFRDYNNMVEVYSP